MKVKVIKKKRKVTVLGEKPIDGVIIDGVHYQTNLLYIVGKDISEERYEENKDLFRTLNQQKDE